MLRADNAYVSEIHHDTGDLEYIVLRPMNWNDVSVGRYAALMDEDPRMSAFRANPYRPLHCRMVVSEEKLHASRTYIEALRPLGIEYTLVVWHSGRNDEETELPRLHAGSKRQAVRSQGLRSDERVGPASGAQLRDPPRARAK